MALPLRHHAFRLRLYGKKLCPTKPSTRALCVSASKQNIGSTASSPIKIRRLVFDGNPYPGERKPYPGKRKPYPGERKPRSSRPVPEPEQPQIANPVNIQIAGRNYTISAIALRDMCQCPLCVDKSTRQKLFYTADIPSDIRAKDVSIHAESVSITWENDVQGYGSDHATELALDELQYRLQTGSSTLQDLPIPRSLWTAQEYTQDTHDFHYESYMANDAVLFDAVQQLHTHGLLFVKNVPEHEESVVKIAERIGPLKTTFYGKTWDVRSVPDASNVAYTAQNLGFHMDLMYMEQPPHLQLLHCIRSSSKGGASLFTDSFKAVDELARTDMTTYQALAQKWISYHYNHEAHYYRQARPVVKERTFRIDNSPITGWFGVQKRREKQPDFMVQLGPLDMVDAVAWSPPFQESFILSHATHPWPRSAPEQAVATSSARFEDWHKAAKVFNKLIHRPECIYERLMRPGECVIFDNRRVLHARRAFDVGDEGKERWLKGAYIDRDPYLSKLKRLRERFERR